MFLFVRETPDSARGVQEGAVLTVRGLAVGARSSGGGGGSRGRQGQI